MQIGPIKPCKLRPAKALEIYDNYINSPVAVIPRECIWTASVRRQRSYVSMRRDTAAVMRA